MSKEEKETFTEQLECALTAEEKALKSEQLAKKLVELKALESQKKSLTAELKAKKENLQTAIDQLSHEVSTGKETRAVECYETMDFEHNSADKYRADTHERIDRRAMHPEERQAELDLAEAENEAIQKADDEQSDLQTRFEELATPEPDNDQTAAEAFAREGMVNPSAPDDGPMEAAAAG